MAPRFAVALLALLLANLSAGLAAAAPDSAIRL
jgi:hypothetical protein